MIPIPTQIWLVVEAIDMRAGIDGLSQRIQNTLGRTPTPLCSPSPPPSGNGSLPGSTGSAWAPRRRPTGGHKKIPMNSDLRKACLKGTSPQK